MSNIPKIIHYCWFGRGEFSDLIVMCINSWKLYLPDYKIIEWNEENFDINKNAYIKEAYDSKKWAFVSDYARLFVLYNYGGIYLDTDVEILKPLDNFLIHKAFSGFETKDSVPTAVMGCEKGHKFIGELMHYYDDKNFIKNDNSLNIRTNTSIITAICFENGLKKNGKIQSINNLVFYPQIIFAPNTISRALGLKPLKSYAIHHFESSWREKKIVKRGIVFGLRRYIVGILRNILGTEKIELYREKFKIII